jgi:N-acetylmuramoyl-L-alanine amidase
MSIPDQSYYNEILCQSIKTGTKVGLDQFSSGNLDPYTMTRLEQHIFDVTQKIGVDGEIPDEAYTGAADILLSQTPGMGRNTLAAALRSNGVFNNFGPETSIDFVINKSLNNAISKYNTDLIIKGGKVDEVLETFGFNGFMQGVVADASSQTRLVLNQAVAGILNGKGEQIRIDDNLASAVTDLLGGNGSLNTSMLPPSLVRMYTSTVAPSGAPIPDVINVADLPQSLRNTLAAEVIKAETGGEVSTKSLSENLGSYLATIAGTVGASDELPMPPPYEIGIGSLQAGLANNNVSSFEELEAEMASITRDVSEIIVHYSDTFTNAHLNARDLTTLTGSGDNAYHLIILRDGSIQRGVPINQPGAHCPVNNHDAYSIGVCMVGGVNVPSGTEDLYEVSNARGITSSQYNTLYYVFKAFFDQFPGGQALGHMDTDASQDDPGFDVRDYAYNNFNKQSLYTDPLNDPALSPDDIIKALEKEGPQVSEKDPDVMDKKF